MVKTEKPKAIKPNKDLSNLTELTTQSAQLSVYGLWKESLGLSAKELILKDIPTDKENIKIGKIISTNPKVQANVLPEFFMGITTIKISGNFVSDLITLVGKDKASEILTEERIRVNSGKKRISQSEYDMAKATLKKLTTSKKNFSADMFAFMTNPLVELTKTFLAQGENTTTYKKDIDSSTTSAHLLLNELICRKLKPVKAIRANMDKLAGKTSIIATLAAKEQKWVAYKNPARLTAMVQKIRPEMVKTEIRAKCDLLAVMVRVKSN